MTWPHPVCEQRREDPSVPVSWQLTAVRAVLWLDNKHGPSDEAVRCDVHLHLQVHVPVQRILGVRYSLGKCRDERNIHYNTKLRNY